MYGELLVTVTVRQKINFLSNWKCCTTQYLRSRRCSFGTYMHINFYFNVMIPR